MKIIKYFFEFLIISFLFVLFKLLGYKIASLLSDLVGSLFGPLFRSKDLISNNIKKAFPEKNTKEISIIQKKMWANYGKILSDYVFIKQFRNSKLKKYLKTDGVEILHQIKIEKKPVIFISAHFNNFELMAMQIEKSGVKLAAIYRPLNNIFLNKVMEYIRVKYICLHQIKKGISGTRKMLTLFKQNYSIALMIDQRVSEGIKCDFFGSPASTTTIPAQLIKKFNCKIVPVHIQRTNGTNYEIKISTPITYNKNETTESLTLKLNKIIEGMILQNPSQWIWSHNRWK
jgi:KDO2-lipid IV(A) lauroyltransferase|tara:strand:+ start:390 stop:1250 length:861 start_codon:yes stop_codon:yes gene_type:complete